jgi:hypothetical protein
VISTLVLAVPGLPPACGVCRGDLEAIACLEHARGLTFDGKLEAAFQDVGGFDPGMRVSTDRDAGFDRRLDEQCLVSRDWTIGLGQDLSRDPACRRRRRTLRRGFRGDDRANRARNDSREFTPRHHDGPPDQDIRCTRP